jgi:NADH-quinone oxidoreductase subunit L
LCSYLLIGFWHREPANGRAARKAFIVTRVGDAAFFLALALLFTHLGTLGLQELASRAAASWPPDSGLAVAVAALLLGGALGKSAQIPLQVWLPDAMAGPTPVSALIHAATMVTAGVYLVARTHVLFELAPVVLALVSGLGAATLLVAALSALAQTDLKRTLAYSTISQIGYMFLALGAGAWSAAIFHLFTHAFFKALLFLGAGAIMHATGGEHDMRKLGGLARGLPLVFFCFLAGALSLSSIPLLTAGFYSKGWILEALWSSARPALWAAGLIGAFLTGLYSFRMVVLVFLGEPRTGAARSGARYRGAARRPALGMSLALVVLAAGALLAGFLQTPAWLGDRRLFSALLATSFPTAEAASEAGTHPAALLQTLLPEVVASLTAVAGVGLAFLLYPRRKAPQSAEPAPLVGFLASGFGFDWVYDRLFVRPYEALATAVGRDWVHDFYKVLFIRPYTWLTSLNKDDVMDFLVRGIERLNLGMHRLLAAPQTGRLRWYLLGISVGAAVVLGVEVFL